MYALSFKKWKKIYETNLTNTTMTTFINLIENPIVAQNMDTFIESLKLNKDEKKHTKNVINIVQSIRKHNIKSISQQKISEWILFATGHKYSKLIENNFLNMKNWEKEQKQTWTDYKLLEKIHSQKTNLLQKNPHTHMQYKYKQPKEQKTEEKKEDNKQDKIRVLKKIFHLKDYQQINKLLSREKIDILFPIDERVECIQPVIWVMLLEYISGQINAKYQ